MAKYLLFVLSGPKSGEGDEEKYNDWYSNTHLGDLKAVPGIEKARRYKVIGGNVPGMEKWPYSAIYEIETDDLPAVFADMGSRPIEYSPAFDRENSTNILCMQIAGDD